MNKNIPIYSRVLPKKDNYTKSYNKILKGVYEIIGLYTVNVRAKKPSLFGKLIMWWCWLKTPELRKIPKDRRYHHCASLEIWRKNIGTSLECIELLIYDAQWRYEKNYFREWVDEYIIVEICDAIKCLNIKTQEDRMKVHNRHEEMLDTLYGVDSIFGIVIDDLIKVRIVGVNGEDRVICDEADILGYQDFLPQLSEPADLIDVVEHGDYIPMKPYNGELDHWITGV